MAPAAGAQFATLHWPILNTAGTTSDAAEPMLVTAAQRGDRAAFGELYRRYVRMVHGILLARVPAIAAEDLVQDVFLQALKRLPSLRDVSRYGPWLAAIARNRAADFHRRAKPESSLDRDRGTAEQVEAGCRSITLNDRALDDDALGDGVAVLNAIRELPDAYREPLILRFVEGMSGPEIAARTGLTHGSVRVNLHRGMQMLRQKLEGRSEKQS
jgi:RNA polymerase sigma-70 factor (ECF subfamily)